MFNVLRSSSYKLSESTSKFMPPTSVSKSAYVLLICIHTSTDILEININKNIGHKFKFKNGRNDMCGSRDK